LVYVETDEYWISQEYQLEISTKKTKVMAVTKTHKKKLTSSS